MHRFFRGILKMKKVYVYILIAAFMYGSMEVALKLAGSSVDSFQLTFLRFAAAGILLLPTGIKRLQTEKIRFTWKDWLYLLLLGVICVPVCMLSFQLGVMKSNASTAAVILSSNPIFTMIFAHFMSNELFTKKKLSVIAIGAAGLIVMIRPWDLQKGNTFAGALLVLVASVTFGLYTVMGKNITKKIGIEAQTSISFLMGSAVLLIIILFIGKPVTYGVADNILIILYVSIFVTGLGYFFYFMAIKASDATTGGITFFLKIIIAPVLAAIILGDEISWNQVLGILLMLTASFMNLKEGLWKKKVESDENRTD